MGTVYLLGDYEKEGIYKIGVTRGDINKRIKKLQTGNSGEIYLVNHFETKHPFMMEKMLHRRFENYRVLNEWFQLSSEELTNFKNICIEVEDIISALENNYFFKNKLK